ncbi:unnamed protein product, partial [Toxocara canis]|uniref:C-type lectin domain-containing protein n=1 Tax=Toxocara canis TaxID=6265 RepID=A0A183U078_TOXCA
CPILGSRFEYACQVLPYRTFFAGGRCFIGVTSNEHLRDPCEEIFINSVLGTVPKLAVIDSDELLTALKQSNSFNPKRSYKVAANTDGSQVFMARSQTSGYSYLCESTGKQTCPPGYEPWNGNCYRFFSEPKTFEEAAEICGSISAFSTMAVIEDEPTNRFLASYARSFESSSDDTGSPVWVGQMYVNDQYWADIRNFDANDKISFYQWFTTPNGW